MKFLKFPPWSLFSINPHIIPCAFRPDLLFALVIFHQNLYFPCNTEATRGSAVHDYKMHIQPINKICQLRWCDIQYVFILLWLFVDSVSKTGVRKIRQKKSTQWIIPEGNGNATERRAIWSSNQAGRWGQYNSQKFWWKNQNVSN